jgi:hypothetical protein
MDATRMPHDLAAVVHVRSANSGGTATVAELVDAAADAEADVILLTERDTLKAPEEADEGWHEGVLLLVGRELAKAEERLVVFGDGDSLRFPAHPLPADLDERPSTGVELWSVVADVAEHCRGPRELAAFISRPDVAVMRPPAHNMAAWDELCLRRRVVAIGGLGAHDADETSPVGRVLSPLRNARFFRMLRTHLLCEKAPSGNVDTDRALVFGALRAGRCYLGRDSLAGTRGFRYYADGPGGFVPMGGEASAGEWTLRVRLPFAANLRLMRDGREIERAKGSSFSAEAREPGVYRVEAELRVLGEPRTWIVSNPIYLRAAHGAAAL